MKQNRNHHHQSAVGLNEIVAKIPSPEVQARIEKTARHRHVSPEQVFRSQAGRQILESVPTYSQNERELDDAIGKAIATLSISALYLQVAGDEGGFQGVIRTVLEELHDRCNDIAAELQAAHEAIAQHRLLLM